MRGPPIAAGLQQAREGPDAPRNDIMKPLPGDHRHRLLISGDELRELKRHTVSMAEAFGLDRKIENYKGSRPITLYRWDLDCLMDVIDLALRDERDYPDKSTPEYQALKRVGERLHQEQGVVIVPKAEPPETFHGRP